MIFWMSFTDPEKPAGQRFLGVCVVEVTATDVERYLPLLHAEHPEALPGAEWLFAAMQYARAHGCNPGGEIMSTVLDDDDPRVTTIPRDRLMLMDELTRLDLI